MANYRFSATLSGPLSVYLGGGVGASRIELSGWGNSDSDTVLTLQSLAGFEYALTESFSARLGYRFMWWNDPELMGEDWGNVDDTAVELGFSLRF